MAELTILARVFQIAHPESAHTDYSRYAFAVVHGIGGQRGFSLVRTFIENKNGLQVKELFNGLLPLGRWLLQSFRLMPTDYIETKRNALEAHYAKQVVLIKVMSLSQPVRNKSLAGFEEVLIKYSL